LHFANSFGVIIDDAVLAKSSRVPCSMETLQFFMFLKEVSYVHQGCIYLLKNTVKQ